MWVPKSIDEITRALELGDLEEHAQLDVKRALPAPKRGVDIAIDVAAMANDGGLILYGVEEDETGRPCRVHALHDLHLARERVDQVVQHALVGPPRIHIDLFPLKPGGDEGCLAVVVPASPEAPHMVLKQQRFYGRGEAGNRPLEAPEIDRLYARRARWGLDCYQLLEDALVRLPFGPIGVEGVLALVSHPVASEPGLLDRLRHDDDGEVAGPRSTIVPILAAAESRCLNRDGWVPGLSDIREWAPSPGGGFRGMTHGPDEEPCLRRYLSLQVDGDGTTTLLCGRGTKQVDGRGLLVAEQLIAILCAQVCAASGSLLSDGSYVGPVDVAVHVDGLRSAVSWERHGHDTGFLDDTRHPYGDDRYRAYRRVDVRQLVEDPIGVARDLILPLTRVTAGEQWDPMGLVRP